MMIAEMLAELGHSVAGEAKACKAGSCLHLHRASMQPVKGFKNPSLKNHSLLKSLNAIERLCCARKAQPFVA
jgi:hypothetical protein